MASDPETTTPHPPGPETPLSDSGSDDLAPAGDGGEGEALVSGHAAEAVGARLREAAERGAADDDMPEPVHPLAERGILPVTDAELEGSDYNVCPFCTGHGAVVADDLLAALPGIVERLAPFPQSARYTRCPGCDGWGTVLTGARSGEAAIQPCPDCDGRGYVSADTAPQIAGAVEPAAVQLTGGSVPPPYDPMRTPPPLGQPPAVGMVWDPQVGSWTYPQAAA